MMRNPECRKMSHTFSYQKSDFSQNDYGAKQKRIYEFLFFRISTADAMWALEQSP